MITNIVIKNVKKSQENLQNILAMTLEWKEFIDIEEQIRNWVNINIILPIFEYIFKYIL